MTPIQFLSSTSLTVAPPGAPPAVAPDAATFADLLPPLLRPVQPRKVDAGSGKDLPAAPVEDEPEDAAAWVGALVAPVLCPPVTIVAGKGARHAPTSDTDMPGLTRLSGSSDQGEEVSGIPAQGRGDELVRVSLGQHAPLAPVSVGAADPVSANPPTFAHVGTRQTGEDRSLGTQVPKLDPGVRQGDGLGKGEVATPRMEATELPSVVARSLDTAGVATRSSSDALLIPVQADAAAGQSAGATTAPDLLVADVIATGASAAMPAPSPAMVAPAPVSAVAIALNAPGLMRMMPLPRAAEVAGAVVSRVGAAFRADAPAYVVHPAESPMANAVAPLIEPAANPAANPSAPLGVSPTPTVEAAAKRSLPSTSDTAPTAAPVADTTKQKPSPQAAPLRAATPAIADPLAPATPRIAPAGEVFAAAIRQAVREERRLPAVDAATIAVPAATPAAQVAGTQQQPALDMARETWPTRMIEHIEALRDAADATDASIRLVPDRLGAIDVSLRRNGERVEVNLHAHQPETRALIAEAQPKLVEMGEARGLRLSTQTGDTTGGQPQQQRAPAHTPPPTQPHRAAAEPADDPDERIA